MGTPKSFIVSVFGGASKARALAAAKDWLDVHGVDAKVLKVELFDWQGQWEDWKATLDRRLTKDEVARL
jgi:hypothetical protein